MKKIFVLFLISIIMILSLLIMCTPQTAEPDGGSGSSSSSATSVNGSSSSGSGGSSSPASSEFSSSVSTASSVQSSSSTATSIAGDSTNFTDAILISTDGTQYLADLFSADQDYYKFNGVSGTTYIIQTFSETDDVDTCMYLYDYSQVQIAENDDNGVIYQSKIIFSCTSTGVYYVMVEGYDSFTTGSYSISVQTYDMEQFAYLKSIAITPGSITAPKTVTLSLNINKPADETVSFVNAYISSPNKILDSSSGQQYLLILAYNSGNGLWEAQCDFNIYNESGLWIVDNISYSTNKGVYNYFYNNPVSAVYYYDSRMEVLTNIAVGSVSVTTSSPDLVKPVLISVSADPTSIDSTGIVNFNIAATDALSGVSSVSLMIQIEGVNEYQTLNLSLNSGYWTGSIDFAPLMTGVWIIYYINIYDHAKNNKYYYYDPSESLTYYIHDDPSSTITAIPVVTITKTGAVSQSVVKSMTNAGSKIIPDKKLPLRHKIKKARKK